MFLRHSRGGCTAVYTIKDFDAWDEALQHICFGLNTHMSLATHTSDVVNVRRLRFAESWDVAFAYDDDVAPSPLADGSGVQRWEIRRICGDRIHKQLSELLVEWVGFDTSHLK